MAVGGRVESERSGSRRPREDRGARGEAARAQGPAAGGRGAAARTLESRRERKADTRRKILVGAIVLAKVEHARWTVPLLERWLEQGLFATMIAVVRARAPSTQNCGALAHVFLPGVPVCMSLRDFDPFLKRGLIGAVVAAVTCLLPGNSALAVIEPQAGRGSS